jgi:hypothetical protein
VPIYVFSIRRAMLSKLIVSDALQSLSKFPMLNTGSSRAMPSWLMHGQGDAQMIGGGT